jgi:uncharacterized membrane protein
MSITAVLLWTAALSFMPISELRGAIPFAVLKHGIPWYWAFAFCAVINMLIAPVCWVFLGTVHRLLYGSSPEKGIRWYKRFFDWFVERARKKLSTVMEKWGWLGIAVFVAIPLPMTGAWTGTLGAWVLGVSRRRTMLAVIIGVVIAGAIVTAIVQLADGAYGIFINSKWSL